MSLLAVAGKQESRQAPQSRVPAGHHQLTDLPNSGIRYFWSNSRWLGLSKGGEHGRNWNLPFGSFYLVGGEDTGTTLLAC